MLALLADGVVRKNSRVVAKIGTALTLAKEYRIGAVLREIPGFIHFIRMMQCPDDVRRYQQDKHATVCSYAPQDVPHSVIIMPYMAHGSFRNCAWHTKDVRVFQSCMKQLIVSLYCAFTRYGFLHTDIHLDNVLLKPTKKGRLVYNDALSVPVHGLQVCIMDFENAFMPVDVTETRHFHTDVSRILSDINYTMRLRFDTQQEFGMYVARCMYANDPIDLARLLAYVDGITGIEQDKVNVLQYDPNAAL